MSVEVDLETPGDRLIGEVLANRYQIEMRLGEGAMGAVYKAKHVKVGRAFAVKVLHPRLLADSKIQTRFEREAELAGRLRHPNVIGIVDVGETHDGLRYMVMDYAEGPDLATLLSDGPMPGQRVIHLTRQMLEGLFHAHEHGLIHRDFKPENVIIERDTHGREVPRIVDFGIAILADGGASDAPGRLTTNGLVLGTPHYMAPEQAVADPIDHRIDLFALGIMVYEMLCGKLPFDGNGADVARANLLLEPPPIATRVPHLEVDPLLEAFARRLMAKKRDQRPATAKVAGELLDLIERDRDAAAAALGVPPDAPRPPMTTQPMEPARQASRDGTFPPPTRDPMQAPPTPAAKPSPEHVASTQLAEPVRASRRKTPLVAAAILGLGVAGAGAFVLLSGHDNGAATGEDKVEVAPPPAETPTPDRPVAATNAANTEDIKTENTKVENTKPEGPKVADTQAENTKAEDTQRDETKHVDTTKPGSEATKPTKTTTKAGTQTGAKPGTKTGTQPGAQPGTQPGAKPGTQPATQPGKTGTKQVETKVADSRPVETRPVEAKPIDAGTLATQYKTIGARLKALEQAKGTGATSDLWERYRYIRISEAMSTQEKRDAAAAVLSKLSGDIAARTRN